MSWNFRGNQQIIEKSLWHMANCLITHLSVFNCIQSWQDVIPSLGDLRASVTHGLFSLQLVGWLKKNKLPDYNHRYRQEVLAWLKVSARPTAWMLRQQFERSTCHAWSNRMREKPERLPETFIACSRLTKFTCAHSRRTKATTNFAGDCFTTNICW